MEKIKLYCKNSGEDFCWATLFKNSDVHAARVEPVSVGGSSVGGSPAQALLRC